jgi:hypothetical protein
MRLVARLPTHPIVSALMITAAVVTTYALVEWLGGSPAGERGFAGLTYNQIGFSIAALAGGYALAAGYLINAENAATLEELGPLLRAAKPARILEDVSLYPRGRFPVCEPRLGTGRGAGRPGLFLLRR